MAAQSTLDLAERILQQFNGHESQGSLASQAHDCAPIVEALGYRRLAQHLRGISHVDHETGE